jgi:uncharacterized integral membrane protein
VTHSTPWPRPDEYLDAVEERPVTPESPGSSLVVEVPAQATVLTTRTGVAWWALGFSLLLLILILIFVLQNLSSTSTQFFNLTWTIPLGLDLLLAVVLGGVIAFLLGAARMLQLRRLARRSMPTRRRGRS